MDFMTEGMTEAIAEGMANGITEGMEEAIAYGIAEGMEGITDGMAEGIADGIAEGMAKALEVNQSKDKKDLAEAPVDTLLCKACQLRYSMNRITDIIQLYTKPAPTPPAAASTSSTASSSTTTTIATTTTTTDHCCHACLNILSPANVLQTAAAILDKLSPYELPDVIASTTYHLNIDIPFSISIVRHGLAASFKCVEAGLVTTVRSILAEALSTIINTSLPAMSLTPQLDTHAKFRIDLMYQNLSEEKDLRLVMSSDVRPAKRRKRRKGNDSNHNNNNNNNNKNNEHRVMTSGQPLFDRSQVIRGVRAYMESSSYVPAMPSPMSPMTFSSVRVDARRNSTFLTGHYIKNQRGLTQSPWFVDGKRVGKFSVQEMLCDHVVAAFKCGQHKFHSAGREDMDVRMLGTGRPFVIELENSLKDPAMMNSEIITKMGDDTKIIHDNAVEALHLRAGGPSCMADMLEGAESKKKTYLCLIKLNRLPTTNDFQKLDGIKNLHVMQQTPIRVLHRRTQMCRDKTVHWMKCQLIPNSNCFVLEVCTSAGAYVKEIVHGDRGRTVPSVADLLNTKADILQLDVVEIVENK